jgi:hypothetical protein
VREQRASPDMFSADFDPKKHPFAPEIQQLDRIAEELVGTVRDATREDDEMIMTARNLQKFCAADYIADLKPMWDTWFVAGHPGGDYMEAKEANALVGWI